MRDDRFLMLVDLAWWTMLVGAFGLFLAGVIGWAILALGAP